MTSNKVISDNEWHSIQIDVTGKVRKYFLLLDFKLKSSLNLQIFSNFGLEGTVGDRSSAWDINIDKGTVNF